MKKPKSIPLQGMSMKQSQTKTLSFNYFKSKLF